MSFLVMFYVHCWDAPTQPSQRQKKEAGPFVATQTVLADNFGSVLVAKFGPARSWTTAGSQKWSGGGGTIFGQD